MSQLYRGMAESNAVLENLDARSGSAFCFCCCEPSRPLQNPEATVEDLDARTESAFCCRCLMAEAPALDAIEDLDAR